MKKASPTVFTVLACVLAALSGYCSLVGGGVFSFPFDSLDALTTGRNISLMVFRGIAGFADMLTVVCALCGLLLLKKLGARFNFISGICCAVLLLMLAELIYLLCLTPILIN